MKLAVKNKLRLIRRIALSVAIIGVVGIGIGAGMSNVWAANNNSFPEVMTMSGGQGFGGSAWKLSQVSPSNELLQEYTTNRDNNDTRNGQFFHVLKNEASSQVRQIRVRAYFTTNPGNVSVNIQQQDGACNFTSGDTSQRIRMNIGGTPAYDGAAYVQNIRRIDQERRFFKFDTSGVRVERDFLKHQNTSDRAITEACEGMSESTYDIRKYDERCGTRRADNTCRGADTNNSGNDDLSEYQDPEPYNPATGTNPGLRNKFEGDFAAAPATVQQIGSALWAVNINVRLDSDLPEWSGQQNQIRFKIRVDGAQSLGFQDLSNESPDVQEKSFGITDRGGFDDTEWGIRAYVPFGMSCRDPANSKVGEVSLYDVDIQEFGYSYMSVFRRDPRNNQVEKINLTATGSHSDWQSGAGRIRATGGERQTSSASFQMTKGYQYMLVVVNPNQRPSQPGLPDLKSPLNNLLSIGIPGESIYGVYDCNYSLTPSVTPIGSKFSYDASFNVTGSIAVTGDDFETHQWQLTRMKYPTGNPDIAAATNTDAPCAFRPSDCQVVDSGTVNGFGTTNFSTNPYSYNENNVPLGTRVCFMMSVRKPTLQSSAGTWSHSEMQCTQSVVTPKVQVHGGDLNATGLINTSLGRIGSQTYGSWGEYGVLSNGINISMGSGNGLQGGVASGSNQTDWNRLTFASGPSQFGTYGNFGGVTVPVPLVKRDGETVRADLVEPATLGSLAGLERKEIYRIPGTLRITGNLDYGSFSQPNDITEIPRIILVADDVIIDPGVTRIDPWIVAIGNGANPGKISTCSTINNGWRMDNAGLYGGPSGICTQQLRFNGPVMANKIFLYRTFDDRNGEPAEIFNLRADAYLSALSSDDGTPKPVATTDFVTELPPRF